MSTKRAFEATARLEKGWTINWEGWKPSPYWPLMKGCWSAVSPDNGWYIEALSWAADDATPNQLRIHQDEARFRLRMKIYLYKVATSEVADSDPSRAPSP